jgi:type VI protein secretion system component VasF
VDAEQCLAREGPAEPVAQKPMEGADAERSHSQPLHALCTECLLESRRLRSVHEPSRQQQAYVGCVTPSQRERKRARRGGIEPLDVVDSNQNRLSLTEKLQRAAHRHANRAVIDGIT